MLAGCEVEVEALSNCKGHRHVANLKAIHLSSIADVLKALNDDLNVNDCDVFKAKEDQEHLGMNIQHYIHTRNFRVL